MALKEMKKMEEILSYLLDNLDTVTLEKAAEAFDYHPVYLARIFKDYFEYPFHKYVMKLRLRVAAQQMLISGDISNAGAGIGFQYLPGFSNAFKKEFGCSPRAFLKEGRRIPDMPARRNLDGVPVEISYDILPELHLEGLMIYPEHGNQTNLMEEAACGLEDRRLQENAGRSYGVWDYDQEGRLIYLLAHETASEGVPAAAQKQLMIPEDAYVIFRVPLPEDAQDIIRRQRMLLRYIFMEWVPVNHKITNRMGITYEFYESGCCGICLPLIRGMYGYEQAVSEDIREDRWLKYINDHILENLTTERLAGWFNYSETIFRTTFYTRYGMTSADYILKRRLILAAEEIEKGYGRPERIARKYGFRSLDKLRELFYQNFEVDTESVDRITFSILHLPEYYENNRQRFRIFYRNVEDFTVLGSTVESIYEQSSYDIHEITSFWFDALQAEEDDSAIYALWSQAENEGPRDHRYEYLIGREQGQPPVQMGKEAWIRPVAVAGGNYAVFETTEDSDAEKLKERYAMLDRCAFYSWIRENRIRYDEKRITFSSYRHGKLSFYVPIKK